MPQKARDSLFTSVLLAPRTMPGRRCEGEKEGVAEGGKKASVLVELRIQVGPGIYVICLRVFKSRGGDCACMSVPLGPLLRTAIEAMGDAQEM